MSVDGSGRRGAGATSAEEYRTLLKKITQEAHANEMKWQRTLERQMDLLRADSLPELLSFVTAGLKKSFDLESVRLVLEDPNHEVQHLLQSAGARLDDFPAVSFVESLGQVAPQLVDLQRPWLGAFAPFNHALLFLGDSALQTIALLPLRRQRRVTGVLCFGSADPQRFNHRLGSSFLSHLAGMTAICLENACNRERVLKSGLSDYLTGWHNRRYLDTRLKEEFSRAGRSGGDVACVMIDVDYFKEINDSCGHAGGDAVLREIATRIEAMIRASDSAIRFGGDEFLLLLPEAALEGAVKRAERIREALVAPILMPEGNSRVVTASIGVASVRVERDARNLQALAERLLSEADAALYQAKADGRNCVRTTGSIGAP
jgi:diguanylate cyclase (GGDEF)-like protein